ncbi:8-amino-7-oxononanoate synthase [Porticoccus sp. W117]|uniref:8-amino-7-oxononanoate synthase n=1 Tax=Porticoccus sp. W117 TaxID=3054777 RepID=UPI0025978869|nr:8-amino-7-oxononanoate synthase [Porticoccus sp. W117]MDM3870711.1 8-amino-7-oxononanoate synthase [Porticoccus sp. W117]
MSIDSALLPALQQRKAAHLYRQRYQLESAAGPEVVVDGKACLGFCSNDYLGLANHPEVVVALQKSAAESGVGSGASHLIYGHSREHHALEEELAAFTGRPRALLFSTGYMANMGTIAALADRGDTVLEDRLNHASLLDGGLLSRADFQRYRDNRDLEKRLSKIHSGRKLVVTDGVFSMDGNLADVPALATTCQQHDAWLMVDDAHGFGVLGQNGGGCAEHFGLSPEQLPILVGTLGKGFGTFGAFVAGSEALIETLIQFARPYIFTTALPPAVAAATRTSLRLLQTENWRREKLQQLITRFRSGAQQLGLQLVHSQTPIQPVLLNDDALTVQVGQQLREKGILVGAIRPPTVPKGTGRLRITLSAEHNEQQVDRLLQNLDEILNTSSSRAQRGDPGT